MDNEVKNKSHLFAFSLPNFLLREFTVILKTFILNKISKHKVNKIKLKLHYAGPQIFFINLHLKLLLGVLQLYFYFSEDKIITGLQFDRNSVRHRIFS